MWVDLQIKYLFTLRSKDAIKKKLGKLPKTLEETYSVIYEKILSEDPEELEAAKRSLMWLMCSGRPLSSREWVNFTYWPEEVDEDIDVASDSLLEICRNLVTVDNQSQVVRFSHLSVQEYLENLDDFSTEKANSMAARLCLSTLLSNETPYPPLPSGEFNYSVGYWMEHPSQCTGSRDILNLLRNFLGTGANPGQAYCNWFQIAIEGRLGMLPGYGSHLGFDHLHASLNNLRSKPLNPAFAVCRYNLGISFQEFLEWGTFDINSRNMDGETLLHIASLAGNEQTVKSLLENGADVNMSSERSSYFWEPRCTPLAAAITSGHSQIAIMLLDFGAGFGFPGAPCINTLEYAAQIGERKGLEAVLNRECISEINETVLVAAARNYRTTENLEMLLAKDPTICVTEAILSGAAENWGCGKEALEVLLAKDSSIRITEGVLFAATRNSLEKALKMLLARDPAIQVQITEPILSMAACTSGEALEMLLSRDINTGIEFTDGILTSAMGNYKHSVKLVEILARHSGNINITVNFTALQASAYFASSPLFHKLLGRCDKSYILTTKYQQLMYAAVQGGNENILRSILELGGQCLEADEHGWTVQMMRRQSNFVDMPLLSVESNLAHPGLDQLSQPTTWDNSRLPDCIQVQGDGRSMLFSGKRSIQLFIPLPCINCRRYDGKATPCTHRENKSSISSWIPWSKLF